MLAAPAQCGLLYCCHRSQLIINLLPLSVARMLSHNSDVTSMLIAAIDAITSN